MSRDWTQEEFKQKDGKMTEETILISKKEWDEYLLLEAKLNLAISCLKEVHRISCEDGYDCFIELTEHCLKRI